MNKTFTWFEFLATSGIDLDKPIGNAEDELFCPADEMLAPSVSALNGIFSFARSYEVLKTRSIGYTELFLN